MHPYKCLLFDLFNTVALWRPERMPRLTIDGESRPSTLGELYKILAAHHSGVDFEAFHSALTTANAELAAERARSQREIPSAQRFERALLVAGLERGAGTRALAAALSLRHMAILAGASAIPAAHLETLKHFAAELPLALVSNFDHGPTARAIVERDGATACFQHLVVSDDHGWRKPHRRIFDDTLALLDCRAEEALFIGDSIDDDVHGGHGAGLDVAWINPRGAPLPGDAPTPRYVLNDITELPGALAGDPAP